MPTSGPGNSPAGSARAGGRRQAAGFTLIELLVVVAIIAFATAGVSLALRDNGSVRLEREAQRLAAMLESGRAQSRAAGVAVFWQQVPGGFRIQGLPDGVLAEFWMEQGTNANPQRLLLGPEPVIGAQAVELTNPAVPGRSLWVATDGVRPFTVQAQP